MTKVYVRSHCKPPGWDVPSGNILQVYLEECDKVGVTANTSVVHQLEQRVRQTQLLPYHKLVGRTRVEKLVEVFNHLDTDGSGSLDMSEMLAVCADINPMAQKEQAEEWVKYMDADGDNSVSLEEYTEAMDALTCTLDEETFDASLLEVLSQVPDIASLKRADKHRAAFRHLDKDNSGFMDLQEFRFHTRFVSAKSTWTEANENLKWMDEDGDGRVSLDEYVAAMEFATSWMSDEDLDVSVMEVFKRNLPFQYDFSRDFVGDKGLLALLPALAGDLECTGICLRGCGIRGDGIAALCSALEGHPALSSLDVSHNPLGERGGQALLKLLAANKKLVEVNVEGTDMTRQKSRTHLEAGPLPCEGGGAIAAAVEANKACKVKIREGANVARMVLQHRDELKTLFYTLAGPDGRASLKEISEGIMEAGPEWGILPADLVMAINPERMVKNGWSPSEGVDDDSASISYAEFVNALRAEDKGTLVCDVLMQRRADVKLLFYTVAGVDGRVSMQEIFDCLKDAITEQGDEWPITADDVVEVLTPRFFFKSELLGDDGKDPLVETLSWSEFWLPISTFTGDMVIDYMVRPEEGEEEDA